MRRRGSPVHENFPMNTSARLPGRNFFDKLGLLFQQGGQNGIILPCMHFHFKSIRISFISKVTRVDKAMIVANDTSLRGAIWFRFLNFVPVTELKFPIFVQFWLSLCHVLRERKRARTGLKRPWERNYIICSPGACKQMKRCMHALRFSSGSHKSSLILCSKDNNMNRCTDYVTINLTAAIKADTARFKAGFLLIQLQILIRVALVTMELFVCCEIQNRVSFVF